MSSTAPVAMPLVPVTATVTFTTSPATAVVLAGVTTTVGRASFSAENPFPRVLAFHGFQRRAGHLLPWREVIPDLGFVHLPGHNGAPDFTETSLACWITGYRRVD